MKEAIRFKINRRDYLKQYETVFLKPIAEGQNAVPVGNGDLAAVAWQPDHMSWMLNKSDIGGAASQAGFHWLKRWLRLPTPAAFCPKKPIQFGAAKAVRAPR